MIKLRETAIYIYVTGEYVDLQAIADATKYRPPEYWRSDAYQLYRMSDGKKGWDGYIKILQFTGPKEAKVLRGLQDTIQDAAKSLEIEVDRSGLLISPFHGLVVDDLPDDLVVSPHQLDGNQRLAIVSWLNHGHGNHKMVVSSGKTMTFCAAAAMIKRRFPKARALYFTPTERLVNQVYREAKKFLPDWNITQYGGGKKDPTGTDMVVATTAILHRNYDSLSKEKWFHSFMTLCCDESHHATSVSMERILLSVPAFFRMGASDTTREDDVVKSTKIHGLIGPIRVRIEVDPLIRVGRVAKPTIYLVDNLQWTDRFEEVPHVAEPNTSAWALLDGQWTRTVYRGPVFEKAVPDPKTGDFRPHEMDGLKRNGDGELIQVQNMHTMDVEGEVHEVESRWCLLERTYDKAVIQFKERNDLIAQWAKHFSDQGSPTLVIATRTLHVLILQANIAKVVKPELVRVLFSAHNSKERDATFEWLRKTPGAVLISPLAKEGVSINELRGGIVADHVVSHELMSQIVGRFIRKKHTGKNECEVVLFIDRQHPRLRSNSLQLIEQLEKIRGYDFVTGVLGPGTKPQGKLHESLF
jgi:superfamily II DNA or RNA helicase